MSNIEDLPTWGICAIAAIVACVGRSQCDQNLTWRDWIGKLCGSLSSAALFIGAIEYYDNESPASMYFAASVVGGFMGLDLLFGVRHAVIQWLRNRRK